jgi:DNA-binding beta-propeller fold protein YncE
MGGGPYATGIVGVYDTLSGAAIAVTPVGRGPAALAVDALHGHVYVASTGDPRGATGSVTILDAASGASLETLSVPGHATNLVVDPRTQHVAVALQALVTTNSTLTDAQVAAAGKVVVLDLR